MTLLILGLLLWAAVHFIPSLAQPLKAAWKDKLGNTGYQITFALVVLLSLLMIIFGWRSATPSIVYATSPSMVPVAKALMFVSIALFVLSNMPTRIKRFIRHPQLTAVLVWSLAHLITNGDTRSVVLFGGLGLWALLEIFAINRRDGEWIKPDEPTWAKESIGFAISLVVYIGVVLGHSYISGVPLS